MPDLRATARRVQRATRFNPQYFAQTVSYKSGEMVQEIDVPVRHREEKEEQPDGTIKIWDVIDVAIDDQDLDQPPNWGDRILLADDEEAYLFAYEAKHRLVSWSASFRRQRIASQGTRGER